MTPSEIIELAKMHADRSHEDIQLASTRIEHVRVSARANEAHHLYLALQDLLKETDVEKPTDG